jgi:hypothetical protein
MKPNRSLFAGELDRGRFQTVRFWGKLGGKLPFLGSASSGNACPPANDVDAALPGPSVRKPEADIHTDA